MPPHINIHLIFTQILEEHCLLRSETNDTSTEQTTCYMECLWMQTFKWESRNCFPASSLITYSSIYLVFFSFWASSWYYSFIEITIITIYYCFLLFYYYYLSFTIIIVFTEKATIIKDETHVTILEKSLLLKLWYLYHDPYRWLQQWLNWPISSSKPVERQQTMKKKTTRRTPGVVALQISEQFGAFDQKTSIWNTFLMNLSYSTFWAFFLDVATLFFLKKQWFVEYNLFCFGLKLSIMKLFWFHADFHGLIGKSVTSNFPFLNCYCNRCLSWVSYAVDCM